MLRSCTLFRLQGWSGDRNLPEALRKEIAVVAEQPRTIVYDGRGRIEALRRGERDTNEIGEQLEAMGQHVRGSPSLRYVVKKVGCARKLTPQTYDDVLEIASEAVRIFGRRIAPSSIRTIDAVLGLSLGQDTLSGDSI